MQRKEKMLKPITFITGNIKKLEELTFMLGCDFPRKLISKDIDLPELQEEIDNVCLAKCIEARKHVQGPVLVEDTSLCYNALNGLPGPFIKWFLQKLQPEGLYDMLRSYDDKSAVAVCTFAYSSGKENEGISLFQGRAKGTIVEPRGPREFGWDPCFLPDGECKTYAELPKEVKNKISHRAKAVEEMKDYFLRNEAK